MNVEEYFPEGLSVIHPDDSQRERRGFKEELQTTFPPLIHCHICYKNIPGAVNNVDFIKPCNCQIMFVHRKCAFRNKMKFGEAKCSNCGQGSTIPRTGKNYELQNAGPISASDERMCTVCRSKDYDKRKQDKRKTFGTRIKPCFCGKVFHFGCFVPLLDDKCSCTECGVVFQSFSLATVKHYFWSNWKYYVAYVFLIATLSTLFTISLKSSILLKRSSDDINTIILTVTAAFFLVLIVGCVICVSRYTSCTAIPVFRVANGKVFLKPCKTSNSTKPLKKVLEPLKEGEFEDIPLSELKIPPPEKAETEEIHVIEDARGYENEDMTLGQHMFGVYATHHSSSTPIDRPSLEFVFDSAG